MDADYTRVFEDAPRGLIILRATGDDLGRIVVANDRVSTLTGYAAAELAGRSMLDVLPEAERESGRENLVRIATGEQNEWAFETRIQRQGRDPLWVRATVWLVRDSDGEPQCFLAALEDMTDERRVALTADAATMAASITAQAATLEGAVAAMLPAFAQHFGFEFGAIWEPDEQRRELHCRSTWQQDTLACDALAGMTRNAVLPAGSGLPGRAWQQAVPQIVSDLSVEGASERAAAARQAGVTFGVALPLTAGPDVHCVLEFFSATPGHLDPALAAAVEDLPSELAPLLAAKRAHERRSSSQELLLVEDNPFVARLVGEMLTVCESDVRLDLVHVESIAAARERLLSVRPACMLLDLTLPDADGLEGLIAMRHAAPEVPIVVLTGLEDEVMAVSAVQEGAQDYLMKRKVDLHSLSRAIRYAMERKGAEQQVLEHRLRDALTGLPNRVLFLDRVRVALSRGRGEPVAALLVNLDRFRLVNDSLGHESGDRLLLETAARLTACMPEGASVASFGGDEFAVLVEVASDAEAATLAERLTGALADPFVVDGERILPSATIGIALDLDRDGSVDAVELIRQADTALSRGKDLGGGRYEIFDPAVRDVLRDRLSLESGLRDAIERRELRTYYQPIIDLSTRTIVSFEALVRWQHPERGLIPPGDFMPVAEESGLIVPLGAQVLDEAVGQLAEWRRSFPGRPWLSVSVNLSACQLADGDLVETVRSTLRRHDVPAEALCLEVTETALIEDFNASVQRLEALKAMGVILALDDFGTGYSSLSYLSRLPVDILKLDRSFVADMRDQGQSGIVAAVAQMAEALGLPALAEGIEEEPEVERLLSLGYALAQGYWFSRPVPADDATLLLAKEGAPAATLRG